jgi:hypothetical protein
MAAQPVIPGSKPPTVTINRKLNLVLEMEGEKGRIHVHAVPISRAIFEENFLVISRAYMAIYNNDLGPVVGPRVAKLMLLREAGNLGADADAAVKTALLPEIERLATVLFQGERGWETLPYAAMRNRGMIDEETAAEIENALVYFTCASSIHLQRELAVVVGGLRQFSGAVTTSLTLTEYKNSLPTWTSVETTGEKPTPTTAADQSSIPT